MNTIKLPTEEIKVQNSLDFYLSITAVKEKSLKEIRKSLYSRFMSEYREDNYPLIDLNKYRKKSISEEEEEIPVSQESTSKMANNFLQTLQKMRDQQSQEEEQIPDSEDIDWGENPDEEDIVWDEEASDNNEDFSTDETEDIVWNEEDSDSEDIAWDEEDDESNESENIVWDENDESNESSNSLENFDIDGENSPYVSHGIYLEDLIDGTYKVQDYDETQSSSLEESDSSNEEEQDLIFPEEDIEDGNANEGNENINEFLDFSDNEEDIASVENVSSEPVEEGEVEYSDEEWFLDKPTEMGTVASHPVKKEVSIEDDGTAADVPSDVRAFLKQHPGSELLYVLKFYSKKDVEKALRLGRIYKKNGKLFI